MFYLITKWFGIFLFEDEKIVKKEIFPRDKKKLANILSKIKNKEILSEERKFVKNLKNVYVSEKRLERIGEYKPNDDFFKKINLAPQDFDFDDEILHESMILLSKEKINEKLGEKDLQIVQMVNALDDLKQTSNLLSERVDIWSNISSDSKALDNLCKTLEFIKEEIGVLEDQIKDSMVLIAPNISDVTGSLIGARLISYAGGLEKLAMMPSSTIQVLGAEKALFRFKKEGGKPPKHGVIFQNNYIHRSPKKFRGRIARVLASKIAIAANADAFTKNDISKELNEELKQRVSEIRNK